MPVVIKRGICYRIDPLPFETEERAIDRALWIAERAPKNAEELKKVIGESLHWVHEKYFNMAYAAKLEE